jgi:hypothetical protein
MEGVHTVLELEQFAESVKLRRVKVSGFRNKA